jgi:hypothetical protein
MHSNNTNNYPSKIGINHTGHYTAPKYKSQDNDSISVGDSITVAFPSENMTRLLDEASISQVSLDSLINQIVNAHLDWHSNAAEAGMIYFPKPLIIKIIDFLTERQLSDIAESVADDFINISLLLRGEVTYSAVIDIIDNWFRITRTPIRYRQDDSEFRIILWHGMGHNYGYLLKEIFQLIMEKRFHLEIDYILTDNTLLLEFIE